jgi:hypothetical protein
VRGIFSFAAASLNKEIAVLGTLGVRGFWDDVEGTGFWSFISENIAASICNVTLRLLGSFQHTADKSVFIQSDTRNIPRTKARH